MKQVGISILLSLLVVTAGCSGLLGDKEQTPDPDGPTNAEQSESSLPTGNSTTDSSTPEPRVVNCANVPIDLEGFAPPPPDGWQQVNVSTAEAEGESGGSYVSGYERVMMANYSTNGDGHVHLIVTEWASGDEAKLILQNSMVYGARFVIENYLIDAVPINTTDIAPAETLLSSVRCVEEGKIFTDKRLTINGSNMILNESINGTLNTSNIDFRRDIEFELDDISQTAESDPLGPYVNITITGNFQNTSATVTVDGPDNTWERSVGYDLIDGEATVRIRPPDEETLLTEETYTVTVESAFGSNESATRELTIGGADISLSNLSLETSELYEGSYQIDDYGFTVENNGEIPVEITDAELVLGEESSSLFVREQLGEDESTRITSYDAPVMFTNIDGSETEMTVRVYVGDEVVANETKAVTIG